MKSRTMPPIESPDTPYSQSMRKAGEQDRALTIPQYKTSLTPPSWPTSLDTAAERKQAQAEKALDDVARREQILSVQVRAHRHCVAELEEERALFEAEQVNHAKKVKLAEEALLRMREQLALQNQSPEGKSKSNTGDAQEHPEIETEGRNPQDQQGADESGRVGNPAPDAGQLLSGLAKQANDFAALAETVTELQRQLTEERTRHEATARSQMDELRVREEALAQRESEAGKRISAVTLQLDVDRESLARAQEEFAAAKRELAELQLTLEATETNLAEREKAHTLNAQKVLQEQDRLMSKRHAIAAVEDGHRERENELLRLEQELGERAAELARRQSDLAATEAEVRAAGQEAVAMQGAVDRVSAELDAGLAKLRSDSDAVALVQQEQARVSAALAQQSSELAEREAALEHVSKEADAVRQQALELRNERIALESKLAALEARETAFEEKRIAFDECRRKFRETFSSMED